MYRTVVPMMFLWVLGGYWVKGVTDPLWVALYATLDRPIFMSLTAFAMFGFFNKIDSEFQVITAQIYRLGLAC